MNKLSLYPQWKRQRELIKQANRRCFDNYPDEFHHKVKMKKESQQLREGLIQGLEVMADLLPITLTHAQKAKIKAFKHSSKYLIHYFNDVIKDIETLEIERIEQQKGGNDETH